MAEPNTVYQPFALPTTEALIGAILSSTEAAQVYNYDDLRKSTRLDLQMIARTYGVTVNGDGGTTDPGLGIRVSNIEYTMTNGYLSPAQLDAAYAGTPGGGGGGSGDIDGGTASGSASGGIDGGSA
jgi:hypothetical protein